MLLPWTARLAVCIFHSHHKGSPYALKCACCDLLVLGKAEHVLHLVQGYCVGKKCQRFPIVIGEFGSRLHDCRNGCASRVPNCMKIEMEA